MKKIFVLFLVLISIAFVGCSNKTKTEEPKKSTEPEKTVQVEKYTIEYDLDGGECSELPKEFEENKFFNLPTPTKEGYDFLGWYEGDKKVDALTNKNYSLKAKWEFQVLEVKIYNGDFKAVDDVSLTIEDGEIFGFIGPNGAGKTTTIKSIVGLIEYEGGQILMDELDVAKNRNKVKAQIAYIPDNPEIYDNLTGIQYLNFIGDICGLEKEARLKDIEKYADMFGITKNLGDLVSSYSHGMKQKLALISAFIRHPKLLILDEPFVGLDPKASHDVKEVMKKMCEEGNSVFFSTHVLEVAEKLCDKVAIINHGKIVASGTMEEVKGSSSLEEVFLSIANNEEAQQ